MNHERLVNGWLATDSYDETLFANWPGAALVLQDEAHALALTIWPGEPVSKTEKTSYHGINKHVYTVESGKVIITKYTGHYFIKTGITRITFAPSGSELHSKTYWSAVLKWLHVRGWLNNSFGTWPADIVSLSVAVFALSEAYIFLGPSSRKISCKLRAFIGRPN